MTTPLLSLSTFLLSVSSFAGSPPLQQRAEDPPVRVWLSSDGDYRFGDRARAFIQTRADGYVVVIHVTPDGLIRPLYPLQPGDDHFVKAGRKIEIKGRGSREAFVTDDTTGRGVVLAAYSKSAFGFSDFDKNGHWDYRALADSTAASDPEGALMDIVQRMQPSERFEYDLATYVVGSSPYAYRRPGVLWPYPRPGTWWDVPIFGGSRFVVSLGFGPRFGRSRYYDSFYYRGVPGIWWY